MGRDASLLIRIEGGAEWVGGTTATVFSGTVSWPSR